MKSKEWLENRGLSIKLGDEDEIKFEELLNNIEAKTGIDINDDEYCWNQAIKRYADKVLKIENILREREVNEIVSNSVVDGLNNVLERCHEGDFHIALVGAIKAGKSTLVNAILDMEIASTSVTPETASLTKFKYSSDGNYIKISFYSKEEWDELWNSAKNSKAEVFMEEYEELEADKYKDEYIGAEDIVTENISEDQLKEEIKKWTSSKFATHYFVKEVEVGLENYKINEGITFVDTPGLDDVVEYRSNITRDYIRRANAVLVCINSDAMTGGELATILSVFANTRHCPEKVFVVGTKMDNFKDMEKEWKEQRAEWIKYLKQKNAYGSNQLASENIIGVSAYGCTLLKKIDELSEEQEDELDAMLRKNFHYRKKLVKESKEYNDFLTQTGIQKLRDLIENKIISRYEELQVGDIEEEYISCKVELNALIKSAKEQQVELINLMESDREKIINRRQECENMLKEAEKGKDVIDKLFLNMYNTICEKTAELSAEFEKIKPTGF